MGYVNPLLRLPAARALTSLPLESRRALSVVLRALRDQANADARSHGNAARGRWLHIGAPSRPTRDT
ncbi:hypothetical protein SAMN05443026_5824 [Burkholderia orbicola]|nr:hypothetical protein SAMN05443026_5824 [Burkholderia orbicola]